MNRNDFFSIVEDREPIKKATLSEIYELVNMFPYFQSAHLLLLKGLNDNEDVRFNKQLRHSALYIASREALYYYLNPRLSRTQEDMTKITADSQSQPDNNPASQEFILSIDDRIETMEDKAFFTDTEIAISEKEELL